MIDLKPYGAFIENTIRPVIEESKTILKELSKYNIELDNFTLEYYVKKIVDFHLKTIMIESVKQVILIGMICLTAFLVCQ